MTESRAHINEIENEQTIIMNPDILPTQKEWRLICKMVKQQRELTDEEIVKMVGVGLDEFRTLLKRANEK